MALLTTDILIVRCYPIVGALAYIEKAVGTRTIEQINEYISCLEGFIDYLYKKYESEDELVTYYYKNWKSSFAEEITCSSTNEGFTEKYSEYDSQLYYRELIKMDIGRVHAPAFDKQFAKEHKDPDSIIFPSEKEYLIYKKKYLSAYQEEKAMYIKEMRDKYIKDAMEFLELRIEKKPANSLSI